MLGDFFGVLNDLREVSFYMIHLCLVALKINGVKGLVWGWYVEANMMKEDTYMVRSGLSSL